MGGLGAKGAEKLRGLVQRTDVKPTVRPQEMTELGAQEKPKIVKKGYAIPFELSEELREYCHKTRKKEVHVIIDALNKYLSE